jgi:DNA modification methylase
VKIRDRIKELRRVKANELIPNPANWRTHPKSQMDSIRGVLAEVGFAGAELAYETDRGLMLIDGHARAEIAGDAEIPVLILDVNEAEAKKILATFDPIGAMADADAVKLDSLLREVETGNQALADMLTALAEESGILDGLNEAIGEVVEDEVPEPPADPITKPGDLWILGRHRVLCGDSTKAEDVDRLMAGARADMVLTDPPYGVSYVGKTKDALKVENDHLTESQLFAFLQSAFANAFAICKPGSSWYVASPPGPLFNVFGSVLCSLGIWRQTLTWVKSNFVLGRSDYKYQHEPFFYGWKPGAAHRWFGGYCETTAIEDIKPRDVSKLKKDELVSYVKELIAKANSVETTVIREPKPASSIEHPTTKPVKLIARFIKNSSTKDDVVYDPFLGSGTTLIAAEQLGRTCYGMEISSQYVDVICNRWAKLTGTSPVLEETGETIEQVSKRRKSGG